MKKRFKACFQASESAFSRQFEKKVLKRFFKHLRARFQGVLKKKNKVLKRVFKRLRASFQGNLKKNALKRVFKYVRTGFVGVLKKGFEACF